MPPRRHLKHAQGLLPNMEARVWSDGVTVTYRYRMAGGAKLNLGTDKLAACRKVLDMLGQHDDAGTVNRIWQQYQDSPEWQNLRERTQSDYRAYSVPLLAVFGEMRISEVTPQHVNRYLRIERKGSRRANREISLLSNLFVLAIDLGEASDNPVRGGKVRRNPERSKTTLPDAQQVAALAEFGMQKGGQWRLIVLAARFAGLTGPRQCEFLPLTWREFGMDEVRFLRGKQRKGVEKRESVALTPACLEVRAELLKLAHDPVFGYVFPNRAGNRYTASGFASMWQKLIVEALAAGVITERFEFHSLRAFYTSEHHNQTGLLPNLHQNPATTATVYNRTRVAKRRAIE